MKTNKHAVLVGVAAVGKTTLGQEAAANLGIPCFDVELVGEQELGMTIDELSECGWKDLQINEEFWQVYQELLRSSESSIIVASPRLVDRPDFWNLSYPRAITVHLRWLPLRILRRELAILGSMAEEDVVLTEGAKRDYYDYYWWRLAHCRKADNELRLSGDLAIDTDRLVRLLEPENG
ncbi:MAG: hypothetical protein HKL84_00525 [Acidimicrobiaceae bacterium]|nr:hypothetical protein [Acidimicrobiaceae bacterium]